MHTSKEMETFMDATLAQMVKRNLEQEERVTERVTALVKAVVGTYDKVLQQNLAEMADIINSLKESLALARGNC